MSGEYLVDHFFIAGLRATNVRMFKEFIRVLYKPCVESTGLSATRSDIARQIVVVVATKSLLKINCLKFHSSDSLSSRHPASITAKQTITPVDSQ
jgi:hypothetical protein